MSLARVPKSKTRAENGLVIVARLYWQRQSQERDCQFPNTEQAGGVPFTRIASTDRAGVAKIDSRLRVREGRNLASETRYREVTIEQREVRARPSND